MSGHGQFDGYRLIQTNADRRAEKIEAFKQGAKEVVGIQGTLKDHLKHRLSLKTILKEAFNHFTDKVIPHGADEIGNVLFSGSAYLPWPGSSGPKPIQAPTIEPLTSPSETVHGHSVSQSGGDDNPYLTGGYKPEPPPGGPGGLYITDDGVPSRGSRASSDAPDDPYLTGSYEGHPEPNPGGPAGMYLGAIENARFNQPSRDEGHTR